MPKDKKDGGKGLILSAPVSRSGHGLTLSAPPTRSSRGDGLELTLSTSGAHPCGGSSARLTLDGRVQPKQQQPPDTSFGTQFPNSAVISGQLGEEEALNLLNASRRAWSAFYNRACRAMHIFRHRICKGDVRKVTMEEFHSLWGQASHSDMRSRSGPKLRRVYTQMNNRAFHRFISALKEQYFMFWVDGKFHWGLVKTQVVDTPHRPLRPVPEVEWPEDENEDSDEIDQPPACSQEEGDDDVVVSYSIEQTPEQFWQTQQIA
ncbi:MAG: hypothetical protein P8J32_03970 [bacterium]|nr:hypothetical protein [bacterium]